MASILFDFDDKLLATQVFEKRADEFFRQLPQPDPQYPVTTAAEILHVTPETVREYFELPRPHPRRLPFVDATGTARGRRVLLSDLSAWQQRNRPDSAPLELPVRRPAGRRAA